MQRMHPIARRARRSRGAAHARAAPGIRSGRLQLRRPWLEHPDRYALQPRLVLAPGTYALPAGRAVFGAIGDSALDTWGRKAQRLAERLVVTAGAVDRGGPAWLVGQRLCRPRLRWREVLDDDPSACTCTFRQGKGADSVPHREWLRVPRANVTLGARRAARSCASGTRGVAAHREGS